MDALKGPVKCGRRRIAVFQGDIDDFLSIHQIHGSQGHPPAPDIFRKRNPCHIPEHPLKMISGTAGCPAQLLIADFFRKMLFDIGNCLVQAFNPFHAHLPPVIRINLHPGKCLSFSISKKRGIQNVRPSGFSLPLSRRMSLSIRFVSCFSLRK